MSASPRTAAAAPPSAALRSFESQWRDRPLDALSAEREAAMRILVELGLPTSRDESWRYTSPRALAARSFAAAKAAMPDGGAPAAAGLASLPGVRIVLANGHPQFAPAGAAIDGLEISTLAAQIRRDAAPLRRHFANPDRTEAQRWALLNTALFADGLYLKISKPLTSPVLVVHLVHGTTPESMAQPRVIIEAAPNASATIIEHHLELEPHAGGLPSFCNSVTQMTLGRGSTIEHYRVYSGGAQATEIDSLQITQEADSRCRQFTAVLGGALLRTQLTARLAQPGAELESFSLLVGHGSRHVDCVNVAAHDAPRTRSRQTARAIASGTSRAVFNSKVIVARGAAQSDSQQSCRGLLLSPKAEIDTRPQLEIHTDDVKCAHGATTGRLDPDMLFYMLSRGLDRDTARSLLVFAFLDDVLTGMRQPEARAAIETALIAQLPDTETLRAFR